MLIQREPELLSATQCDSLCGFHFVFVYFPYKQTLQLFCGCREAVLEINRTNTDVSKRLHILQIDRNYARKEKLTYFGHLQMQEELQKSVPAPDGGGNWIIFGSRRTAMREDRDTE